VIYNCRIGSVSIRSTSVFVGRSARPGPSGAQKDPSVIQASKRRHSGRGLSPRRELLEKLSRRCGNDRHRTVKGCFCEWRSGLHAADLLDVLTGSSFDLLVGGGRFKSSERCDVAAHDTTVERQLRCRLDSCQQVKVQERFQGV